MQLWLKQLFCDHWYKAISNIFESPYFWKPGMAESQKYQVEQCKQCGKLKITQF